MGGKKRRRLGDVQLAILKVLWQREEATVADVHDALADDLELAFTTVATMLRKMEARGLVTHREDGRRFIYHAALSENEAASTAAADVLDRLFDNSLAGLVSHLLESRKVNSAELDELARLIAKKRRNSNR